MDGLTPIEDSGWRHCRDCAAQTGRCPQHASWVVIIPAITIVPETVVIPAVIVPSEIKIVSTVSDPPVLTAADLLRIQQESARLHDAFTARTTSMEILTADDLRVRV